MVRVNVPTGPPRWVVIVRIEVAVPLAGSATGLGLNEPLVLVGRPLRVRFTFPLNPASDVTASDLFKRDEG